MITSRLDMLAISVIVCMDLYLLYECLGKFDTIKEKHFMIDIMVLR
jgi:hypothetical protein